LLKSPAEYLVDIENLSNLKYVGKMYFWSQNTELSLIFDTGSAVSILKLSIELSLDSHNKFSKIYINMLNTNFTKIEL